MEIKKEYRKKIKVGLTGGVFDLIHLGHVKALKQAKSKVDLLIVVIAREEMIKRKGRKPIHSLKERVELVESIRFVDLAIPGKKNKEETLRLVDPEIVFVGYDQQIPEFVKGKKVIRLKPFKPKKLKTSVIEKYYKEKGKDIKENF